MRDYSFLLSAAKYKAKYGEGLKILTPMIQGLPIALAVVKAGNKHLTLMVNIIKHLTQKDEQTFYFLMCN